MVFAGVITLQGLRLSPQPPRRCGTALSFLLQNGCSVGSVGLLYYDGLRGSGSQSGDLLEKARETFTLHSGGSMAETFPEGKQCILHSRGFRSIKELKPRC